jgi:hypothetical protein
LGLRRRTSAVGAARSARARTAVIKGGSKHHAQKPRFTPKKISVRAATYLAVQRRCELKGWPGRWLHLACLTLILLKVFAWRINRLRVFSRALPRATSRRGLTNGYCRCYGGNCFRIYEIFGFSGGTRSLFFANREYKQDQTSLPRRRKFLPAGKFIKVSAWASASRFLSEQPDPPPSQRL